jgi:ABC-2 type transport system permease protein
MLRDAWLVVMKEYREVLLRMGSVKGTIFNLVMIVVVFGVVIPARAGLFWVRYPLMPLVYGWLPLFLVSALVADSFAGERERHTLETLLTTALPDGAIFLGKLGAAVLYGYGMLIGCMLLGLLSVNVTQKAWAHPLFYRLDTTVGVIVIGFLVTLLIGAIGVLVSIKAPTVRQAGQSLSLGILGVTAGPGVLLLWGFGRLPDRWQADIAYWVLEPRNAHAMAFWIGVAIAVLDAVILAVAAGRFKRSRLVFD